jgi:hypothetical protein
MPMETGSEGGTRAPKGLEVPLALLPRLYDNSENAVDGFPVPY